jgi:hypothetical protein
MTYFESYGHRQAKFLNHVLGTLSKSGRFWDPKMFTKVRGRGYKWDWYATAIITLKLFYEYVFLECLKLIYVFLKCILRIRR